VAILRDESLAVGANCFPPAVQLAGAVSLDNPRAIGAHLFPPAVQLAVAASLDNPRAIVADNFPPAVSRPATPNADWHSVPGTESGGGACVGRV
jgi:hypothetical protein